MTNDRVLSAACFSKAAESLPNARCLLPDAPGHGGRLPWAMRPTFYPTLSADEHVRDFDAVLQTMLATQTAAAGSGPPWRTMQEMEIAAAAGSCVTCVQREQESFAPVDLIGYSMGGSTAKFLKRSNYMYGGHYT